MSYEHIDIDRVQRLVRDLVGDLRSCVQFIDEFVGSWDGRVSRVHRAVGDGSLEDALASLLSIASSSRMLGAERLGDLAQTLYLEARNARAMSARGADCLARVGAASCDELRRLTAAWRTAI